MRWMESLLVGVVLGFTELCVPRIVVRPEATRGQSIYVNNAAGHTCLNPITSKVKLRMLESIDYIQIIQQFSR